MASNNVDKDANAAKGHSFERRLIALFLFRATRLGYRFDIMKGNDQLGGKFDDLIFRYKKTDGVDRYRYVQAKHKGNVNEKIRASQLLDELGGDFSLWKYFQSYCNMIDRGDTVQDCIIITNIDFDEGDLQKNGIEIDHLGEEDDILDFRGFQGARTPNRCKLKFNPEYMKLSEMKILAKQLMEFATRQKKQTIDLRLDIFKHNHVALVKENVIDKTEKKFHRQFIDQIQLTPGAKELRQYLENIDKDKWKDCSFLLSDKFGKGEDQTLKETCQAKITNFFDRLVFVVQSPNEEDFLKLLEENDIRHYYSESEAKIQTTLIFEKIEGWAGKEGRRKDECLTPEFGRNVLLQGVDESSNQYIQKLVKKSIAFNTKAVQEMAVKIKKNTSQILCIKSWSPIWSSVKVISAVQTMEEYNYRDNQLISPFQTIDDYKTEHGKLWVVSDRKLIKDQNGPKLWRNRIALRRRGTAKTVLIIVCKTGSSFDAENLLVEDGIPTNQMNHNFNIILITGMEANASANHSNPANMASSAEQDDIPFKDLHEETKRTLLSTIVSFQSKNNSTRWEKIEDLIPKDLEKRSQILNFPSIQELWAKENPTLLPPMDTTGYDEKYVSRTLAFLFGGSIPKLLEYAAHQRNSTLDQLNKIVSIGESGAIKWHDGVDEKVKYETWNMIKSVMEKKPPTEENGRQSTDTCIKSFSEDHQIRTSGKRIIITGVAGTGKSTILSSFYHRIKQMDPTQAIMKIALTDNLFKQTSLQQLDKVNVVEFFLNLIADKKSVGEFLHSLMRHRLANGDGITLFLDGFDEICEASQNILMKLINKLNQSVRIYITTRTHVAGKLEFQMSQLAFKLNPFTQKDQIDFLVNIWRQHPDISKIEESSLEEFASTLVDLTAKALRRENNENFIGIPLQCRILAECYQFKICELIKEHSTGSDPLKLNEKILSLSNGQSYDLVGLYSLMIETKKKILQLEKLKIDDFGKANEMFQCDYEKLEKLMKKLALKTIVQDQEQLNSLLPTNKNSTKKELKEDNFLTILGMPFGLVHRIYSGPWQFLHRTYAEYLMAKLIAEALPIDDEQHNGLLDNEKAIEWIVCQLLMNQEYKGVRTFLDSMLRDNQLYTDLLNIQSKENTPQRYKRLANCLIKYEFRRVRLLPKTEIAKLIMDNWKASKLAENDPNIFKFVFSCMIHCGEWIEMKETIFKLFFYDSFWKIVYQFDQILLQKFLLLYEYDDGNHLNKLLILSARKLFQIDLKAIRNESQEIFPNVKEILLIIKNSNVHELEIYRLRIMVREPDLSKYCIDDRSTITQLDFPLSDINSVRLADLQAAVCDDNIAYIRQVHQQLLKQIDDPSSAINYQANIKRYMEMMTEDSDLRNPLSIAVLCYHQEIGREIIAFLKELLERKVIHQTQLDDMCIKENGCLYRAYFYLQRSKEENDVANNQRTFDSLKLIEDCAKEITEAHNLIVNKMTNDFMKRVYFENEPVFYFQCFLDLDNNDSIVERFHTFWKLTNFMRQSNPAQYESFLQFITKIQSVNGRRFSHWTDYLDRNSDDWVAIFLYWVDKKLGQKRMEQLVMGPHPSNGSDTGNRIIDRVLSDRNLGLFKFNTLIANFGYEKQLEIRDQLWTREIIDRNGYQYSIDSFEYDDDNMKRMLEFDVKPLSDGVNRCVAFIYSLNPFILKLKNAFNYYNAEHYGRDKFEKSKQDFEGLTYRIRDILPDFFWEEIISRLMNGPPILGGTKRFIKEMKLYVYCFDAKDITRLIPTRNGCNFTELVKQAPLPQAVKNQLLTLQNFPSTRPNLLSIDSDQEEEPDKSQPFSIEIQSSYDTSPQPVRLIRSFNLIGMAYLKLESCDNDVHYLRQVHQFLVQQAEDTSVQRNVFNTNIATYMTNMMTSGEQGFNLLYDAAFRNDAELCLEVTSFCKKLQELNLISQKELDKMFNDKDGCLYLAYFDTMEGIRNQIYLSDTKVKYDSCKFIEDRANEMTETGNLLINRMTNRFMESIDTESNTAENDAVVKQDPCLVLKQHICLSFIKSGDINQSIIDGFYAFWKSTAFMKQSKEEQFDAFVTCITRFEVTDWKRTTLWSDFIGEVCHNFGYHNQPFGFSDWGLHGDSIAVFLFWVNKKLGPDRMEKLVMGLQPTGPDGENLVSIIDLVLSCGNLVIFEALISNFDYKRQLEIRDESLTPEVIDKIIERMDIVDIFNIYFVDGIKPFSDVVNKFLARFYTRNRFLPRMNKEDLAKYRIRFKVEQPEFLWIEVFSNLVNGTVLGGAERFVKEVICLTNYYEKKDIKRLIDIGNSDRITEQVRESSLPEDIKEKIKQLIALIHEVD